jgi:hypothetical protein
MKLARVPSRTTPGFGFSIVERTLLEGLASRKFGRAEALEVARYFGAEPLRCVYCDSEDVRRWDHLVPVAKGGETVLGNMVPACGPCDDSKQHLPFDDWLRRTGPTRGIANVEGRIERLNAYAHHYHYSVRAFEERLTPDEAEQVREIREAAGAVRSQIENLIAAHAKRNG